MAGCVASFSATPRRLLRPAEAPTKTGPLLAVLALLTFAPLLDGGADGAAALADPTLAAVVSDVAASVRLLARRLIVTNQRTHSYGVW